MSSLNDVIKELSKIESVDLIFKSIKEILLLFPDGILFGSLLLAVLTLSQAHATFFFSLMESILFLGGFQKVFQFYNGKTPVSDTVCKSKFHNISFQNLFTFTSASQPSYAIYIVAVASSYLVNSIYNLQNELDVLNSSYSNQAKVSFWVLSITTLLYITYRVLNKCDSMSSAVVAGILGAVVGTLLIYQNTQLFGRESVNFIGVPLLRNLTANNEPIYMCSNQINPV